MVHLHSPKIENRKHFMVLAAQAMRRVLVDHARRHNAGKRDAQLLPPDSGLVIQPDLDFEVVALDDALNRLSELDPEKERIVELRYFAGLSVAETAEVVGRSPATVKREPPERRLAARIRCPTALGATMRTGIIILLAAPVFAQPLPKFDGADVHASRHIATPVLNGPLTSGGLYKIRFATMVDLISLAYNVEAQRVLGGPTWLALDRFDVVAKPPAGSTAEGRRLMLRALLADRFHLAAHTATQPMRTSALRAAAHTQLKPSGGGPAGCGYFTPQPRPTPTTMSLRCHGMSMPEFAEQIRNLARQGRFWSPLPVVDQTGLSGGWDFEVEYDPQLASVDDNTYLSQILEKEVGLKLEDIRVPAPVIEVASVDRAPTPNASDLAKIIPPLPAEFDAAEIKPADLSPGARQMYEFKNGRVYMPRITVAYLIYTAWEVSDPRVVGLPKWAESDQMDFVAEAPPEVNIETSATSAGNMTIDLEPLRPLLRAFLIERFKMKVHTEDRLLPAYSLTAVKPKLAKADASARIACHDGPPPDAPSDARNSALGRPVTCQNMTMAQFAELLPLVTRGDVHDVFDDTGIAGAWQFSFNFVGMRQLNAARGRGDNDSASDPTGRYSIFDALSKQLGLKLEAAKRPLPVLVIDHIELPPA